MCSRRKAALELADLWHWVHEQGEPEEQQEWRVRHRTPGESNTGAGSPDRHAGVVTLATLWRSCWGGAHTSTWCEMLRMPCSSQGCPIHPCVHTCAGSPGVSGTLALSPPPPSPTHPPLLRAEVFCTSGLRSRKVVGDRALCRGITYFNYTTLSFWNVNASLRL